jgi:hypothetical protein
MTIKRRRFKQENSLDQRLAALAKQLREQAETLPPGPQRDHLLRQARHTEAASHMNDWLQSPGLQSPT